MVGDTTGSNGSLSVHLAFFRKSRPPTVNNSRSTKIRHATRRLLLKTGLFEHLTHRRFSMGGVGSCAVSSEERSSVIPSGRHSLGGDKLAGFWSMPWCTGPTA